ncbi:hypothetical protein D9O29_16500 [Pantoea vagans]|uniref:Uncharacterized protein n=1 Tax=Pantoea vagans TaxID=470934 RepID=A0ABY3LCW2_9GAMM|nr:hypothetical protein D9O29_16500 [Pantoea vagans]
MVATDKLKRTARTHRSAGFREHTPFTKTQKTPSLAGSARAVPGPRCFATGVCSLRFKSGRRIKYLHKLQRVYSNEEAQCAGNTGRGGKRPTARKKTPGAFLNNAKRWPGYGRTSGMRCVIARAERPIDGLSDFPI